MQQYHSLLERKRWIKQLFLVEHQQVEEAAWFWLTIFRSCFILQPESLEFMTQGLTKIFLLMTPVTILLETSAETPTTFTSLLSVTCVKAHGLRHSGQQSWINGRMKKTILYVHPYIWKLVLVPDKNFKKWPSCPFWFYVLGWRHMEMRLWRIHVTSSHDTFTDNFLSLWFLSAFKWSWYFTKVLDKRNVQVKITIFELMFCTNWFQWTLNDQNDVNMKNHDETFSHEDTAIISIRVRMMLHWRHFNIP